MLNTRAVGRVLAVAAVVVVLAIVVAVVLRSTGTNYTVHAVFQNASQIVKGNLVQVAGVPIGKVASIQLTPDGQADLTLHITRDGFAPLHEGTLATVREASLSGVANRYVDLRMPSGAPPAIPDGGTIGTDHTTSAVDLDQLFNTFDPPTRRGLSGTIRGFARQYLGKGVQTNRGWLYVNPSLVASSRLFHELDYDTPLLERFVVASSKLVTDLADRHQQITGLVSNLNQTTHAIGIRAQALQQALGLLPPFMRRADTTFVNLRATLDDLKPLVDESKPVAPKLRRLLAQLRPLTHDARPTLRDLSRLISTPGANNDLIEATKTNVPVKDIAVGPVQRNGAQREGALPATTKALQGSVPELAFGRPYAVDLTGWFDDFSNSGVYDAVGGESRAGTHVNAFASVNGTLTFIPPALREPALEQVAKFHQNDRCPGAAERGAAYKPTPDYPCDLSQVPPGR
jgi:phospholipid/cholesterol/gamma-HCH transport system substrate-binding protein